MAVWVLQAPRMRQAPLVQHWAGVRILPQSLTADNGFGEHWLADDAKPLDPIPADSLRSIMPELHDYMYLTAGTGLMSARGSFSL